MFLQKPHQTNEEVRKWITVSFGSPDSLFSFVEENYVVWTCDKIITPGKNRGGVFVV